jgi:ABC-2 type transport system ATP-binding protein
MSSHITSDLEKIADSVTFIDKGKLLISGYKDDILNTHAMIRCSKSDFAQIDKADFISARLTDFGAEVMVADRMDAKHKYSGLLIEKTTLEDIMLFYVNAYKKEWN